MAALSFLQQEQISLPRKINYVSLRYKWLTRVFFQRGDYYLSTNQLVSKQHIHHWICKCVRNYSSYNPRTLYGFTLSHETQTEKGWFSETNLNRMDKLPAAKFGQHCNEDVLSHNYSLNYLFIFQLIALNCHFYKQHIKTFVLFKF